MLQLCSRGWTISEVLVLYPSDVKLWRVLRNHVFKLTAVRVSEFRAFPPMCLGFITIRIRRAASTPKLDTTHPLVAARKFAYTVLRPEYRHVQSWWRHWVVVVVEWQSARSHDGKPHADWALPGTAGEQIGAASWRDCAWRWNTVVPPAAPKVMARKMF